MYSTIESLFDQLIISPLHAVLFFNLNIFNDSFNLPFVVMWLVFGGLFLTVKFGFIGVRCFRHALSVAFGKYETSESEGEISPLKASASALSATVGIGNIAGVAIAVQMGGPGAIFWMVLAGVLGMSTKFAEVTLGVKYRKVDEEGRSLGGPMRYLSKGLQEKGWPRLGRVLAVSYALMCIAGSLGVGNMFQANQALMSMQNAFPVLNNYSALFGAVFAALVGLVLIGGIKRIGNVAGVIVPFMCGAYLLACGYILVTHGALLPAALGTILSEALSLKAGFGGLIGAMIIGFQRAVFSNGAGIGVASIAHAASTTKEPVREGLLAMLEPFVDTVVICFISGLVIVVTGVYAGEHGEGMQMTAAAFASLGPWFRVALGIICLLFAFSTLVSFGYYGERSWKFVFGNRGIILFKCVFVGCAFLGCVISLGKVLDFSDLLVLAMAVPNLLGLIILSGTLKKDLKKYWNKYGVATEENESEEAARNMLTT